MLVLLQEGHSIPDMVAACPEDGWIAPSALLLRSCWLLCFVSWMTFKFQLIYNYYISAL